MESEGVGKSHISKKRVLIMTESVLVKHVKYAGVCLNREPVDAELTISCPKCNTQISNDDIGSGWAGLPAGVKFKPTDTQLLMHLAAKCGAHTHGKMHGLLDEFIETVGGDDGICYTHPRNLPGASYDGNSCHVFYRICNAHTRGTRKIRQIKCKAPFDDAGVRWHMTGRPKPIVEGGIHYGYKKIFVLHSTSKVGVKSVKHNWILHQYHLGDSKDEIDGQLVVGKVFFQQQTGTSSACDPDTQTDRAGKLALSTNSIDDHANGGTDHKDIGSAGGETLSTNCQEIAFLQAEVNKSDSEHDSCKDVDSDDSSFAEHDATLFLWGELPDQPPYAEQYATALAPSFADDYRNAQCSGHVLADMFRKKNATPVAR